MVSNEFIQGLMKRYSIYLFGECTIVIFVDLGGITISCKQSDGCVEYTADYVFDYDGKETADLSGIEVKIVDTKNGVDSYFIQSKNVCYTYSTLQFVAQMVIDNNLDLAQSAKVIIKGE